MVLPSRKRLILQPGPLMRRGGLGPLGSGAGAALELLRFFGIEEPLTPATAAAVAPSPDNLNLG